MSYQKFGNKPTVVNGIKFQSKLESDRYTQLRLLEQAGEISGLMLQVEFQILKGWINSETGEKIRSRHYVADFVYFDHATHQWIIEDTKGQETAEFRLKWDYMKSQYGKEYVLRKVTREDI